MEGGFLAAVHLHDLDLLDQLERLEDVGDVVEPPNSGLHHRISQSDAVDHFGGEVQVDFRIRLKENREIIMASCMSKTTWIKKTCSLLSFKSKFIFEIG